MNYIQAYAAILSDKLHDNSGNRPIFTYLDNTNCWEFGFTNRYGVFRHAFLHFSGTPVAATTISIIEQETDWIDKDRILEELYNVPTPPEDHLSYILEGKRTKCPKDVILRPDSLCIPPPAFSGDISSSLSTNPKGYDTFLKLKEEKTELVNRLEIVEYQIDELVLRLF